MHFLPDVYVTCDVCKGKRYNRETLEVKFKGKSIADVLDMTVERRRPSSRPCPPIRDKLETLQARRPRLHQGRPAGDDAVRRRGAARQAAKELSRRATGRTLYILDEPTTGLHFEDVRSCSKCCTSWSTRATPWS
jgi:excinuclease ABC subunit A